MIPLKSQGALRHLPAPSTTPSRAGDLDVLVNEDAVVPDFLQTGIGDLASPVIESRRPEDDVVALPVAGFPRRVDPGGGSLVSRGDPRFIPSLIETTAITGPGSLPPPAVENLDLIAILEIDP